jgi:hypothetical protein
MAGKTAKENSMVKKNFLKAAGISLAFWMMVIGCGQSTSNSGKDRKGE